ncbi:MAG TPA: hypothetical protein VK709_15685 [Candidatus Saccharimonadales bacterium]|nr:hypothetical protein [Candidatus Saccharimonadales bacterium]
MQTTCSLFTCFRLNLPKFMIPRPMVAMALLAAVIFVSAPLQMFAAVSVTISPASVNLSPNGTQQFTATVTGAGDTSVTWTIQQNATGGTILASGLYTAPGTVGVYNIIATSNADNTQSASATVSVAGFIHTGLLNPAPNTATLLPNGMVLYTDAGSTGDMTSPAEIYNPANSTSTATGSMTILRTLETATLLNNGKVLFAGGKTSGGTTATAELYDPVAGTFAATGSMTVPRQGHTATLLPDGKVLIVGGIVGNCSASCSYTTAEIYDPGVGAFSSTAGSMLSPPGSAASILLSTGKVLIGGGGINGAAELFDPATGLFTQTGALVNQNDAFSASLLPSGKVLFVAGGVSGVAASTAEIYDPGAGTFAPTGNLKLARSFDTATSLNNGQVLIVGGISTAPAELFDSAAGTFTLTGGLQEARTGQLATLLPDGTVIIAGGNGPFQGVSSLEVYDPSAKSFSSKSIFLKAARSDHAAAELADGRLLLTGGEDASLNVLSSAEIYNPAIGVFSFTGPLLQARHGHTATLLGNGTVLIVGGYSDSAGPQNGNNLVSAAEIYNPVSGTFSLTSSPNIARAYHTATLLANGNVLIAGGVTAAQSQSPTSSIEIYDPVAQTFTQAGNMFAVRDNQAAALLNDGRVLISDGLTIAGTPGNGIGLDEIYDPSSGQFTQAGPKEVIRNNFASPAASILMQNGQVLADNQSIFNPASNSLTILSSLVNLQTILQDYEFALLPSGQVLATSNSYTTYVFDPAAQTFSLSDSLQYFRSRPTLYTLPNHEVMVAGGAGIAQVEFYVPAVASSNPAPTLSAIVPSTVVAGGAGFTMQVDGSNFVSNSVVNFNGAARQTTFLSVTQLNLSILDSDIPTAGSATITVTNPASGPSGGATSNPLTLTISAANIQPVAGTLSPASTTAGGVGFTLLVDGSNFVSDSVVNFNGVARQTTFVSGTQLSIAILPADIANAGTITITVTNPASGSAGGVTSNSLTLTILAANIQPVVGNLSPASTTAGGAAFLLLLSGSGFTQNSAVTFKGNPVPSAFLSSAQLQANIPANAIATAGSYLVAVTNPGGNPTAVVSFTVNNPVPQENVLSPASAMAGSAALTLGVSGSNFNPSSKVLINSAARTTVYMSSTLLQTGLLAGDLMQGATLNVAVSNPAPGGGVSPTMPFAVSDYSIAIPVPAVAVSAGQIAVFNLTVAPSNGIFSNPVLFSVTGLPPGAAPSFSPSATITPGVSSQNISLSVTTTAHASSFVPRVPSLWGQFVTCLSLVGTAVLLIGFIWLALENVAMRWRRFVPRTTVVILLICAASMMACSTGGAASAPQVNPATGTPAGTYTITVTATSGGVEHSASATIIVN